MRPSSRRPWRPTKDQISWTCVLLIAVFVGFNFWAFETFDSADAAQIDPTPTVEVTVTPTTTPGIPAVRVWGYATSITRDAYLAFEYNGGDNVFASVKAGGSARSYTWEVNSSATTNGGVGFTLHALEGPHGPVVQAGDNLTVTVTFIDGTTFDTIGEKIFLFTLGDLQAVMVTPFGILDADPNSLQGVTWHRLTKTWVDCNGLGVRKALLANKAEEINTWALTPIFNEGALDQYAPPPLLYPDVIRNWNASEFSRLRGKYTHASLLTAADDYQSIAVWQWKFQMPFCASLVTPIPTDTATPTPTPTSTPAYLVYVPLVIRQSQVEATATATPIHLADLTNNGTPPAQRDPGQTPPRPEPTLAR